MENKLSQATATPDVFFAAIIIIAAGLGIYGFYTILTLTRSPNYESRSFQTERFMLGMFNILLSVFAIYTIVIIMQINAGSVFTQTNKLLGQLK